MLIILSDSATKVAIAIGVLGFTVILIYIGNQKRNSRPRQQGAPTVSTNIPLRTKIAGSVDSPSPLHEGYLYKKASKLMLNPWQKRYFVLRGGQLHYYKHDNKAKLGKTIDLNKVEALELNERHKVLSFVVQGDKRGAYVLRSDDIRKITKWHESMKNFKEELIDSPRRTLDIPDFSAIPYDVMCCKTIPFNEHQRRMIDTLIATLADDIAKYNMPLDLFSDVFVMRYVIGKKGNFELILSQMREAIVKRAEMNLNAVREQILRENLVDDPLGYEKLPFSRCGQAVLNVHQAHGKCKELGLPVVIYSIAESACPELIVEMGEDAYCLFYLSHVELRNIRFEKKSLQIGRMVKGLMIFDLAGLAYKHLNNAAMKIILKATAISERCYPEMVRGVMITRNGWVTGMFWKIAEQVIDENTARVIRFCGADFNGAVKELLQENSIPQFLGGKCACHGGKCVYNTDFESLRAAAVKAREDMQGMKSEWSKHGRPRLSSDPAGPEEIEVESKNDS